MEVEEFDEVAAIAFRFWDLMINKNPDIINLHEVEYYDSHNMIVYLMNDIDLMASTKINKEELPHLRKAFWHAQQMARVGNWLSTWKREIKEKDFSSGVFAYIFSNNIVKYKDQIFFNW